MNYFLPVSRYFTIPPLLYGLIIHRLYMNTYMSAFTELFLQGILNGRCRTVCFFQCYFSIHAHMHLYRVIIPDTAGTQW